MKKILSIISILFILISCGEEEASKIGEAVGRGIVRSFSPNNFISLYGRQYYQTIDCSNSYAYIDADFDNIPVFDCILYNSTNYVSFDSLTYLTSNILYIIRL